MIKWLYEWHDWGIYAVNEVDVLKEGLEDSKYPNSKFAIVLSKNKNGGRPFVVDEEHLFNTRKEADEYGAKNCPRGAF